jgi:hypothetical protein
MPNILIQVNETTSSPSWWSDWKQGISYIFRTTSSILHPHGGLIYLKTNPRDKIECSRFARKVMYNNFEKENNLQLWNIAF